MTSPILDVALDRLRKGLRMGRGRIGLGLRVLWGVAVGGAGAMGELNGATVSLPSPNFPGVKADGSVLLPNQWSLRPAGKQHGVGDFPVNIAVHPSGKHAVVLHAGYGAHELIALTVPGGKVLQRTPVDEAFYGLSFSKAGDQILASGAGEEVVHRWRFAEGILSDHRVLRVRDAKERGVVSGVVWGVDGRVIYCAELFGMSVTALDAESGRALWSLALQPGAVATDLSKTRVSSDPDLAAAEKRGAAQQEKIAADAPWPYGLVADPGGQRLYVSLWGRAEVAVIDLATRSVTAHWAVEEHPNEMVLTRDGKRLFVANANRNTVSVLDTATGKVLETLLAAMHPEDPPGSTPNSLALSSNDEWLFVANAGVNSVAVFEVEEPGRSRSMGFIPVGWYPTSVRVTGDGKHLLVANGKGQMPRSNRHGPQPGREAPANLREYIAGLFQGTVSVISIPGKEEEWVESLQKHTAQALKNSPAPTKPEASKRRTRRNPIPAVIGGPTPIKHVLYVIKENRTYDQVLGDMPEGNGDPSLCLFPESVTPNHHKLAREFVLLDNFYVESEVSADGHEWTVGAYATDFVEKTWPLNYGHNSRGKYPYPSEGNFRIAEPASGYLWDRAREAGVTYRSYGEFLGCTTNVAEPAFPRVKSLEGHFDPWFRPWDMDYPDVKRAERFISELKRFEREGAMPRLQILRLPNDHTYGTSKGKPTPRAMMADNDLALGMLVEAVSRSKFWATTAIFVVEDDAQNGPDHVDAHRSIAYVISPYAKRRFRDSTMYSTCSMLRTMELILGMRPMSQFDAAAAAMYHSFQSTPDLRPYTLAPVAVDREERNLASAWGSERSATMDFSKEDAADDLELNEIIWRSVRGVDQPMPRPVRAAFVLAMSEDEEEEEREREHAKEKFGTKKER